MLRYRLILTALLVALVAPFVASAQTATINTFSPYSMYGLGDLQTQGTALTRSMGGAGIAMRIPTEINLLNPASYSAALNKSVLFNYGMEGANTFNSQMIDGAKKSNSYATFNIHDIAMQLPLAKKLGASFSVSPYSSVGYDVATSEMMTDLGMIGYNYSGAGDITQVKLGVGWEAFKNFSIGVSAQYYWGELTRSYNMIPVVITGDGSYYSTTGESVYTISKLKYQVGLQWSPIYNVKQRLTIGATYDFGGDINPATSHAVIGSGSVVNVIAKMQNDHLSIVLPSQIATGIAYQTPKLLAAVDYTYQDWNSNNKNIEYTTDNLAIEYNRFSTVKAGVDYTPRSNDVRNYFNRISYRAGLRYGGYQYTFGGEQLKQAAITAGAGLPLKMGGISNIDVGIEYGSLSGDGLFGAASSLIRQDYIKFSLGFTLFGEDYWFQRPKFD